MIKVLFEQFKDHKRCSYMIANALDAGNKFTAAQISRKLKQLGLRGPRLKRSKAQMHLRDENLNDSSAYEGRDSEKETLLSFRQRSKSKDGGRLFGKELQGKNTQGNLSDDSGDETLSSMLKKSRKLLAKPKDDRLETVNFKETNEDLGNGSPHNIMERDGCNESSGTDVARTCKDASVNHVGLEGTSEAEVIGGQNLGVSPVNKKDDLPYQFTDNYLEYSCDDATAGEKLGSSISRRKLRMVIDPEDDD